MRNDVPLRGRDLRILRLSVGLSQEELAARAGIGTRTVRNIETGRTLPQPRTLRLLTDALGLGDAERERLMRSAESPPIVPRELPPPLGGFAGRERQLAAMRAAVADGARVIAVQGMAGVGKTSLVVEFAHEIAAAYGDAQVFIDMHGFTSSVAPRPGARAVLTRVLRALGVPDDAVPADFGELTARYRSVLAGRSALLVFDNVPGADALGELLPSAPRSLVIATSRRDLSTLAGAFPVQLDPASPAEAVAMLSAAIPGRADEGAAAVITELCGGLPLAIGLAAARLRSRPDWTAADLLRRLGREDRLLDELDIGDRGVTTALRASYLELDTAHRLVFRRLGLAPGEDVDVRAAAALTGTPHDDAETVLESLVDVHLVETRAPGRYRLHDLVRLFAERLAAREETATERREALLRLVDTYRHFAYRAAAILWPAKRIFTEGAVEHDLGLPGFADKAEALAWYRTEPGNLTAAITAADRAGHPEAAWDLATAVNAFSAYDRNIDAQTAVNDVALAIAERLDDPFRLGYSLGDRGGLLIAAGRYREAVGCVERAVTFKHRTGDLMDTARTMGNLGLLYKLTGRFQRALGEYEAAQELLETVGGPVVGANHINIAIVRFRLGDVDEAERSLDAALPFLDPADTYTLTRHRVYRGVLARERGDLAAAIAIHTACLDFCRAEGIPVGIVSAQTMLAEDLLADGRPDEAVALVREVLDLATKGFRDPERGLRNSLGVALTAAGRPGDAVEQHDEAARLAERLGDCFELARAHDGLAAARSLLGDAGAERRHLRLALDAYRDSGMREADVVAARLRELGG